MTDAPTPATAQPKAKKEKAPRDPAMVKALKDKADRKNKARKDARDVVIAFLKSYGEKDVLSAAAVVWPNAMSGSGAPRAGGSKVTSGAFLKGLFPNGIGTTVDELTVFTSYQYGRAEMRSHIVKAIKNVKLPEDRVWVKFDFGTKLYTLVAEGADVPEGWTGYKPVEL